MAQCTKCKKEIPANSGSFNLPSGILCIECGEKEQGVDLRKQSADAVKFLMKKNLWEWISGRGGMQVGKEELIQLLLEFKYYD